MPELLGRMFQNGTSRSPHLPGRALRALAAGTVLALVGCGENSVGPTQANPTMELPPISAARVATNTTIFEEVDNFHFLPPIAPAQEFTGTFDADLDPVVEICRNDACESTVATLGDADEEHYVVNWHTRGLALGDYTISVSVRNANDDGDSVLGYADVTVVARGKQAGVKRGRTLPIKFRIEEIEEPEPTVCDALIAYWPADGPSADGTAEDIIGGKNGTLTGGAEFVEGGINLQAFSFDGISGSMRAPDFSHQGPFTLALWAKTGEPDQDAFTGVFASADGTPTSASSTFQIDLDGAGNYRVQIFGGTNELSVGPIATGDFQHIAVTSDGTTVRTYLNGSFVDSFVFTLTIDLVKLGTNRGGGLPFSGLVDEVQIFDQALTDAEIQDIVSATGTLCKP